MKSPNVFGRPSVSWINKDHECRNLEAYNNKGRLLIDLSTLNSLMVNYPLARPKKIYNWNRFDSISAMVATQLPNQDVKLGFPTVERELT